MRAPVWGGVVKRGPGYEPPETQGQQTVSIRREEGRNAQRLEGKNRIRFLAELWGKFTKGETEKAILRRASRRTLGPAPARGG